MQKKVRPRPKQHQKRRHFIREWRKHRHLTQEQLADRIGLTTGMVSHLETNKVNYTQPTLEAIAEALQCTPGDLLNVNPIVEKAIWSIWETLDVPARNQVTEIAETFRRRTDKTGTED